jgi:hypothetical protein
MILVNFKGSDRDLLKALTRHLPGETEENDEKPVWMTGVPTEIRTDHLQSIACSVCTVLMSVTGTGDRQADRQTDSGTETVKTSH